MSTSRSSLRMLGRSLFSAVPPAGRTGLAARLPAAPRTTRPTVQSPFSAGASSSRLSSSLAPTSFRREALKPTTIVLIFVPILTGFLGVWQIQRLKWKVALIEEVDKNLAKDPIALPNRINLEYLPEFSFRRVLVRGYFSGPAFLLGPQTKDGIPGYSLICPLVRPNGTTILLNRGFITTTRAKAIREGRELAPGLNTDGTPTKEEVVVEGMLLKPGERSVWTPDNNVEGNEWFWRDVETMAKLAGGEGNNVQPVLVDAIEEGQVPPTLLMQQGMPVGRPAQVELRNQHASYAATWFTLCAATSAMLVFVLRKGKGQPKLKRREF